MATKQKVQPPKEPDALIIGRAEFKGKLLDRVDKGKVLSDRTVTNMTELEQLKVDFSKWDDFNSEMLKQSFNNEENQYKSGYDQAGVFFNPFGHSDNSGTAQVARLQEMIENKLTALDTLIEKVDLLKSGVGESKILTRQEGTKAEIDSKEIFIVHGHNTAILQSVARTIEKLGLVPIVLHEKPNSGRTIIEKFETNSNVGFAIVLLTDDDEGKAKTEIDLKKRARQNVVLELGYFIGKLGRKRVLSLYSENVEIPSDIHGLLYVPIDGSGNWKFSIVRELKEIGFDVDANKLL
jgi:predicted nucleotide-binding protein